MISWLQELTLDTQYQFGVLSVRTLTEEIETEELNIHLTAMKENNGVTTHSVAFSIGQSVIWISVNKYKAEDHLMTH